jgi:diguanylate cyclase (GGDEF)-like protein
MLAYAVMSILIYYFTFRYVPNSLIENTLSLVIRDLNSGLICFDSNERCAYANGIIKKMYDVEGNTNALYESKYKQWLYNKGDERKDSMTIDNTFEDKDGHEKNYEVIYKRIYDKKGHLICDYFMVTDRTEEIQSLKREQFKATHDTLTQLLNREAFYEEAAKLVNDNPDKEYTLLCTNIKDFKFVNELFGIEKGDEVLRQEANLLRNATPLDALCARLRSDRFAVMMEKGQFKEEVWRGITKEMQTSLDNNAFKLHVYAGVYNVDDRTDPVSIMCDKATLAGELVKDDYHDCIAYYNKDILEKSIEERRVIAEFDRALNNEEFVMFLQPQCDGSGQAHGAEALVRWQHPSRGLLSPFFFIDILEKAGLVHRLDNYIWNKAAQQLASWKNTKNSDYHISVNISTKDFYLLDLYETFVDLVNEYEIEPARLKLEITETALMTDFNKNMDIIRKLQNYGFMIEIDDFGSGYSSLNMLKDISADILKIDMGFLRASENEVKGRDILETIIELAQKLGMEVITEGVETKKQLDMLNAMGCGMYQGYYFSKPIPVGEFEERFMQ